MNTTLTTRASADNHPKHDRRRPPLCRRRPSRSVAPTVVLATASIDDSLGLRVRPAETGADSAAAIGVEVSTEAELRVEDRRKTTPLMDVVPPEDGLARGVDVPGHEIFEPHRLPEIENTFVVTLEMHAGPVAAT